MRMDQNLHIPSFAFQFRVTILFSYSMGQTGVLEMFFF